MDKQGGLVSSVLLKKPTKEKENSERKPVVLSLKNRPYVVKQLVLDGLVICKTFCLDVPPGCISESFVKVSLSSLLTIRCPLNFKQF